MMASWHCTHSHLRPDLEVKDPKQAQRNKGYVVDTREPSETRRRPSRPCRGAVLDLVRTPCTPILILLRLRLRVAQVVGAINQRLTVFFPLRDAAKLSGSRPNSANARAASCGESRWAPSTADLPDEGARAARRG